ncbi:MAG: sugar phosphate isomerase/epimerase family protein [Fimbriimonas sp.]
MPLAISLYSYFRPYRGGRIDVAEFIREAKRAGADGVELLAPLYRDPANDFELATAALAETGLLCPIFSVSNDFTKPDRGAELGKIRFGVEEARRYGAGTVRVFAGDVKDGVTFEDARAWIVEGLTEASRIADGEGVFLALENHGQLAGRGDQVRDLIQEVRAQAGNDALGANPDTGNFLLVDQPSHQAIAQVASLAYMVHFKDFAPAPADHQGFTYSSLRGDRFVGTAVGEGVVDLPACLSELDDAGFHGWLSIEYEGEEDPFTAVPRSVVNARRLISPASA